MQKVPPQRDGIFADQIKSVPIRAATPVCAKLNRNL